jgi:hypothetical protein
MNRRLSHTHAVRTEYHTEVQSKLQQIKIGRSPDHRTAECAKACGCMHQRGCDTFSLKYHQRL